MAHFFQLQQLDQESPPAAQWQLHMRPISVITGHSWITPLPFSECDTPPSTKVPRYRTIHTLLMRSRSSCQTVNYSLQTAQVKIVILPKDKEAFMANLGGNEIKTHLTSEACFGLITFNFFFFFGASERKPGFPFVRCLWIQHGP